MRSGPRSRPFREIMRALATGVALLVVLAWAHTASARTKVSAPARAVSAAGGLTPLRARFTDDANARDLGAIEALGQRIAAFDTVAAPDRVYTRAEAAAWLALARDQYRLDDRSGLVEAAFARASDLASRLEAGGSSLDSLPRAIPGAPHARPDLRAFADSLRASEALRCVAEPLARFELELVRSGHETLVCRSRDPHPHGEALDRRAAELRALADACVPPVAVARPVAPPPAPEPEPAAPPPPPAATLRRLAALNSVHFDLNADTLSKASAVVLDSVAAIMRNVPGIRAALIGHTDSRGSAVLNLRLGMRRATVVRDYLARAGVEMARLAIESAGMAVPTAHGAGLREYALNRRVEIQYSAPGGVMLDVLRQERDLQIERPAPKPPAPQLRRPDSGTRPPAKVSRTRRAVGKATAAAPTRAATAKPPHKSQPKSPPKPPRTFSGRLKP